MQTKSSARRLRRALLAGSLVLATTATSTITAQPGSAVTSATAGTITVPATTFERGQKVTVKVTIPRTSNKRRATGTVDFTVDGDSPVTVAVNSAAQALLGSTTYALGTHTVSATYSGDAIYAGGEVGEVSFEILEGNTTTTLTSLKQPVPSRTRARINARTRVVAPARASVLGTTTFSASNGTDAPTIVPIATNSVGTALWQPLLADGTWTVTATYDGNRDLNAATSAPIVIRVGATADSTIDQANWGGQEWLFSYLQRDTLTEQTFVAGRTGVLDRVDLRVYDESNGRAAPLTVTIRTVDPDGKPTSTVIGSGTTTTAASGSTTNLDAIVLTSPAAVTAGTTYAISLSSDSDPNTWLSIASGDNYTSGLIFYTNSNTT
ncbi:MAG: fibronectin type domain protein, partial [Acidimicrobiales bacterium]|nr:fibronectin type domain protein [Acidimicrobiales bacterium]